MTYNILQVGRDVVDTGGGRVILETSFYMHQQGHSVTILTDSPVPQAESEGIRVVVMPIGTKLKNWNPKLRITRTIRHFLQIFLFSVWGTVYAVFASRREAIIINHNLEILVGDLMVFHNVFSAEHYGDKRSKLRKLVRWFNPVFTFRIMREKFLIASSGRRTMTAVSRATRDELARYVKKRSDLKYINNGVNTKVFCPAKLQRCEMKSSLIGNPHAFVILFVGHEYERKGLSFVVEALASLPDYVQLVVLGGRGSSQPTYTKMAKDYGVAKRVVFLGTIMDTAPYYQMSDVFILPSAYETWALVGLEAMACGTPAFMTPVGGIVEYLDDGENGLFIERDSQDIANKIKMLINDHHCLNKMRMKARETALLHSWNQAGEQYLTLVSEKAKEKANIA